MYNGKRIEANSKLADEAKWLGLDRIFVDLTLSRRLACAVSSDNDGGGEETLFPVGTRTDRRNEIIYCVWRPVVDWPGFYMARPGRPRTRHARPAARRDGQPCSSVGRGTGNAFPTHSATDRQISTTSAMLPACNTSSDVCAADRYSSVFEQRRSSKFSIVLSGSQRSLSQ